MTPVLYGLARVCIRRRLIVIGVWVVVAVALVVISQQMGDNTNDNLSLPGTNSQRATDTLDKSFPSVANGSNPIVVKAPSGKKLTDSQYANAIGQATSNLSKDDHVASAVSPLTQQGAGQLNKDQTIGYISVTLNESTGSLTQEQVQSIIDKANKPLQAAGLHPATGGQMGQKVSKPATESSELVGIIAAAVILTFTFGTISAMLLPIITAIFGLASTLAIIRMLGHVVTVPTVAPTLGTMIGLGVGIDYALFIITRHFRGLKDELPMDESIARAAATSGGAVFFAGCTVTIALVSLSVAGIPLVTTMGLMAAIAVVVAVLAALTLLPAVLGVLGPHINSLRVRHQPSDEQIRNGLWAKWAHEISRQPIVTGLAALAILIPLSIPLLSLTLGQQDNAAFPTSTTIRQSYDLMTEGFGAGSNGPLIVAVSLGTPASSPSDSRLTTLQKDVSSTKNVVAVTPVQLAKDGKTAFFNAVSK
jgi:RND superfamily putative drug exporter